MLIPGASYQYWNTKGTSFIVFYRFGFALDRLLRSVYRVLCEELLHTTDNAVSFAFPSLNHIQSINPLESNNQICGRISWYVLHSITSSLPFVVVVVVVVAIVCVNISFVVVVVTNYNCHTGFALFVVTRQYLDSFQWH